MGALNSLMNDIYSGLPEFNRELTGFLPAVAKDAKLQGAAKGQKVIVPLVDVGEVSDYEESMINPTPNDSTTDNAEVTIEKVSSVKIKLSGETELGLKNSGSKSEVNRQRIHNAMRKLANDMESYIAAKMVQGASRAHGTVGTVPFGTAGDLTDIAQLNLILNDNAAPKANRQLVLNAVAFANMQGKMSNLFKANEAGSAEFLRTGYLSTPLEGFKLWNSSGLVTHSKGTGTGYLAAGAVAKGKNEISLDTGSGTILAGDIVTFAGDSSKYIVNVGATAPGAITIGRPGLRSALADNAAMTIGGDYLPSVAFARSAFAFAARVPAMPEGGDSADDVTYVTDPETGISFGFFLYKGHGMNMLEVAVAYGGKVVMPENVALLIQ